MIYLGIDPGAKGGWALGHSCDDRLRIYEAGVMTLNDMQFMDEIVAAADIVGLERAQGAPGQAHQFEYGRGFGRIEGLILARRKKLYYLSPVFWKARMGVPADKSLAVQRALVLLPELSLFRNRVGNVPDGVAEAALIALALTNKELVTDLETNLSDRLQRKRKKKVVYSLSSSE